MNEVISNNSYSRRLFGGNRVRRLVHNARFLWFKKRAGQLRSESTRLVELGCFDGRLLSFCPFEVTRYQGFDANVEGGLRDAQTRFADHPHWKFTLTTTPDAFAELPEKSFDLGACLETLEHIPPSLVSPYLKELARVIDGKFLVSVPNEKGLPFLAKHIYKSIVSKDARQFTAAEVVFSFLGITKKVERNEHKGFDYSLLIEEISEYFDVISVENANYNWLPVSIGFTVGIICVTKQS